MKRSTALLFGLLIAASISNVDAQRPKKHEAQTAPTLSSYPEPFDFHGIQLGSTMAQFYDSSRPEFHNGSTRHPNDGRAICSDSGNALPAGIHASPVDLSHGGGACGWGFDLLDNGFITASTFRVGDGLGMGEFHYIATPGEDSAKLYLIHLQFENQAIESVLRGLTAKFGPPTEVRTEVWQNRAGGSFDNHITVWRNLSSQIIVKQLGLAEDEGSIDYVLTDHYTYERSLERVSDAPRNAANM